MASTAYVYAIVPPDLTAAAPPGLDELPVELEAAGPVAALMSSLPLPEYSPEGIERGTADLEWLGPRATQHDRVVTWASDQGAAIPLPMFSMYADRSGVQAMLRDRQSELRALLERVGRGREYALRVYRADDELTASLPDLSPEFATRSAQLATASPGQRYLLERKLEREARETIRALARDIATAAFDELSRCAIEAVREPPPPRAGDPSRLPLALNAFFLVAPARLDEFRATVTALIQRYGQRGLRFEFTGPWPAYHFVGSGHR